MTAATKLIKLKDTILANNERLQIALNMLCNLRVVRVTNTYQDWYGKADVECKNWRTGNTEFVQIKYCDKDHGDIRISRKEIEALKNKKNLCKYQVQLVGDQSYDNLTESVVISSISVCNLDNLQELFAANKFYGTSGSLKDEVVRKYKESGYRWASYTNPSQNSKNYYLIKYQEGELSVVFKSIPAEDHSPECFLIPKNLAATIAAETHTIFNSTLDNLIRSIVFPDSSKKYLQQISKNENSV